MKHSYSILLALLLAACSSNDQTSTKQVESAAANPSLNMEWDTLSLDVEGGDCQHDENNCITVHYLWMQSKGTDSFTQQINQLIQTYFLGIPEDSATTPEQVAQQYLADYDSLKKTTHETSAWQIERELQLLANPYQVLSFRLETYDFTGGVNPSSLSSFLNLNPQNGQKLQLSTLFSDVHRDTLSKLASECFALDQAILLKKMEGRFELSFTNDIYKLNDNFGFTESGLLFVLNNFEYSTTGEPVEFTIPYSRLQEAGLINEEWPFKKPEA
ncbi:MAG: DUF3298 domain-containing protein [Bacteroidetes bacterium]|nr:MAG: DUF3298 domain-containing protein [Bacteroidota bacterium]